MNHDPNSLWSKLNKLIELRGYVPVEEIYRVTLELGYKMSNAERRLRKSESPLVEGVEGISKRGTKYIKGYQRKPTMSMSIKIPKIAPNDAIKLLDSLPVFSPQHEKNLKVKQQLML